MADSKSNSKLFKKTKSISNTNNTKTSSKQATSKCVVCPICSAVKKNSEPSNDMFCKAQSGSCGMLLDKLDLQYFKETTLKKMKSSFNSSFPSTRDACIEHALDMVIENLIQNGHLESSKAKQMRNQLMKSQIAAICDDMLSATAKIAKASVTRIRHRTGSFTNSKPVALTKSIMKEIKRSKERQRSRERLRRSSERFHRSFDRARRSLGRPQKSTERLQRPSEKLQRPTERSKEKLPRKEKSQPQKWAIQPVALPITIVTDQNLPKLPDFTTMEKINLSMKESGSVKAYKNMSVEEVKKPKPAPKNKTKSLDSSGDKKQALKHQQTQPLRTNEKKNIGNSTQQQASSEVSSSTTYTLENNAKLISSVNITEQPVHKCKPKKSKPEVQTVEPKESPFVKEEDSNKNIIEARTLQITTADGRKPDDVKKESVPVVENLPAPTPTQEAPQQMPVTSEIKDNVPVITPLSLTTSSKTVTISSLIGSNTTIASSSVSGYHIFVDMRGFQNNEISMEVAGRQLHFLASRSRRNDFNARKVTEIVDVPERVKMDNLKIGRRTDGYVIIEECEQENAQKAK